MGGAKLALKWGGQRGARPKCHPPKKSAKVKGGGWGVWHIDSSVGLRVGVCFKHQYRKAIAERERERPPIGRASFV